MIAGDLVGNLLAWSLQAGAVAVLASILPVLFRLDVAGVRYAYWRGIAILCLALPWIQPYRPAHAAVTTDTVTAGRLLAESASAVTPPLHDGHRAAVVLAVLAIGLVARLVWLACGLVKLQRLRRSAAVLQRGSLDADLQPTLRIAADVRYSPALEHPVTFGLRKPVVLLPGSLQTQPSDIQRAVLGHEMLHVQRRDWAWLIVEELAVCAFWFHPASWWLASRIQLAREEVVDELAILLTGRRKVYVEALLAFADATSIGPTAAFARRRHLFRRIALVSKENVMSSRRIVVTCAAMALIVGAGSLYAVSAFPLHGTHQTVANQQSGPGPLERKAHAVTPENPIPRRIHSETPLAADAPAGTGATVIVKITIDDVGRVAEARVLELAIKGEDYRVSFSGDDIAGQIEKGLRTIGRPPERASVVRQAADAFIEAALSSVREWRYDPPAAAPLAFDVVVRIGTAPEIMQFQSAGAGDALRIGSNISAPAKIKDVQPVYPPVAQAAHVAGVVIMEVRIGTDGHVEEAHVLRSIPLLDQAALDAVKQWEFTPTLLNGVPKPVIMTVTINFTQQ
jgi:TonB family protein